VTTTAEKQATCGVCGQGSVQLVLASTTSFGQDLEGRPEGPARWAFEYEIETCPACSYTSWEIVEATPAARDLVTTERYRSTAADATVTALAARFLAAALVAETDGRTAEAGWLALRAAWACDDDHDDNCAKACRERALELFEQCGVSGLGCPDEKTAHAVLANLLRRLGRFSEALREYDAGLSSAGSPMAQHVLNVGRDFAAAHNSDGHSLPSLDRP
jgi:hypothetical protein